MDNHVGEKISVISVYYHETGDFVPLKVKWHTRVYTITEITMHFTLFEGETLVHIFMVTTGTLLFRLKLNTKTLQWRVEETQDSS